MVWFQCEDCGENLKKPKLPNHFRICSAFKLSCIDCGEIFGQQSVQGHNQCITEAEKYGPKGQGKATPAKPNSQSKQKPEVDINVGLSSHAPWYCSLCNTNATSRQTLLLHAEGKKHRAKARAFHASKEPPKLTEESAPNSTDSAGNAPKEESLANTDAKELKEQNPPKVALDISSIEANGKVSSKEKRQLGASENGVASKKDDTDNSVDLSNGVVIQAKRQKAEEQDGSVKKTIDIDMDKTGCTEEANSKKIKWKKIITSILKSDPNGAMDKLKLRSRVLRTVKESYPAESKADPNLKETFMHKITSSSKFIIDDNGKCVRLAAEK